MLRLIVRVSQIFCFEELFLVDMLSCFKNVICINSGNKEPCPYGKEGEPPNCYGMSCALIVKYKKKIEKNKKTIIQKSLRASVTFPFCQANG